MSQIRTGAVRLLRTSTTGLAGVSAALAVFAAACADSPRASASIPDEGSDRTAMRAETTQEGPEELGSLHFRMVTRFGFGGSMYHTPEFFLFLPGDRVYRGIPKAGLEAFDFQEATARDPGNTGTFQVARDSMFVEWADGSRSGYRYEAKGAGELSLDGLYTGRVRAFPEGFRLAGSWTHLAAASSGAGSMSATQTLELRADGSFRESNVAVLAAGTAAGLAAGDGGGGGDGSYELRGNTLTLRYGAGHAATFTAFPFGDGAETSTPEMLNLNGRMFQRQG